MHYVAIIRYEYERQRITNINGMRVQLSSLSSFHLVLLSIYDR
jgi:hypothetical protein